MKRALEINVCANHDECTASSPVSSPVAKRPRLHLEHPLPPSSSLPLPLASLFGDASALRPAPWLHEKTGAHHVAEMALRMLWSWVTPHAVSPHVAPSDLAAAWFARRTPLPCEADAHLACALMSRVIFESDDVMLPDHTSTHPRLYRARLRDGGDKVVVKWHPFFPAGADAYHELALCAHAQEKGGDAGDVSRFEPLLAFSHDVLHGMRFAEQRRRDPIVLTAHVVTTYAAMALPRFKLRAGVPVVKPGAGLYAIMERGGEETLYDHVMDAHTPVSRRLFLSVQWQALYTLYVLAMRDGWAHADAHPRNVMFTRAEGVWRDRDWLYVLPPLASTTATAAAAAARYYVLPAAMHGNWVAKLIDFGRSEVAPKSWPAAVETRLRYDFQLLLHGHLRACPFHDPLTTSPDEFQTHTSTWVKGPHLSVKIRRQLVAAARALCKPATNVHDWPAWITGLSPVNGPYASLAEALQQFPLTLVLAGALHPPRDVCEALKTGRLIQVSPR